MRLLLDTHAFLWWVTDDSQLSTTAREAIGNESNEVFVSAASAWGISIKTRIGKLKGIPHLLKKYNELIVADNFFTPPHHPPSLPACGKFRLRTQGPV